MVIEIETYQSLDEIRNKIKPDLKDIIIDLIKNLIHEKFS